MSSQSEADEDEWAAQLEDELDLDMIRKPRIQMIFPVEVLMKVFTFLRHVKVTKRVCKSWATATDQCTYF